MRLESVARWVRFTPPGVSARVRLYSLVVLLLASYVTLVLVIGIDEREIRGWIDGTGWAAPLVFIPVSAVLGTALVPGAALATVAGILFGTWLGFGCAMCAAVLSSQLSWFIGDRGGREGFEEISGKRMTAIAGALARSGTWGVVVQRLIPGVPDGPCNYLFALAGTKRWQLALGTVLGSAPRALGYAALGDSLDDLVSPTGGLAATLLIGTFVVGVALAAVTARRARREAGEG
jgi:uncharacterized membrane protein YdjX (TVP38/TMEM64 family)